MEPSLSWGLRMAVATVVPVIWGISTGHEEAAEWIAVTADCICWVALKGTYPQRWRVLLGGAVLALGFAALGSLTGKSTLLSIGCMVVVAFMAGLFKNLGERGSGLSLCVYVMFLKANAHPLHGLALEERLSYVLVGGVWNAALGMISIFFTPVQQPYRRTIALIWRASAGLMKTIARGWDGKTARSRKRDIYLSERDVRTAIDTSFAFHERAVHQLQRKEDGAEYQLAHVRKAAALVAAHMIAIAEELEAVHLNSVDEALRLRLAALMQGIQQGADRMSVLVLTRRAEERLLMQDELDGIRRELGLLEEYRGAQSLPLTRIVRRVMHLSERCLKLMSRSIEILAGVSERSMFRAYSVIKTIYILHPRHWWRNIRLLFSPDSHMARYALRTALASGLATAIYKGFDIDHGFWLPFTVIIVLQPYFVATIRKAIDRLIGTLFGGFAGGLLLLLPAGLHIKEAMLFVSSVAMIHFFRIQYRVSAFFITLNLVLIFSVSQELDKSLIFRRAGLTLAGAVIAVAAGFILLPNWDRKWLPRFASRALERNWSYFRHTFSSPDTSSDASWTRFKRHAEVSNSNAFDSFNRATQEPGGLRKEYATYYQFITHNVQITRELNNFHLEEEAGSKGTATIDAETAALIWNCAQAFTEALEVIQKISEKQLKEDLRFTLPKQLPALNAAQKLYISRLYTELKLLLQNLHALIGMQAEKVALAI